MVSVKIIGVDEVRVDFKRYAKESKNLTSAFNDIADDIYDLEKRTFDAQGKPNRWQSLSAKYGAWKSRHYPSEKILSLTGTLRGAAMGIKSGKLIQPVRIQTKSAMTIGLRGILTVHHYGSKKKNLPARKIYQFTRNDIARWSNIYEQNQKTATDRIFGL